MSDNSESIGPGDIVIGKKVKPPAPRWRVHQVHKPTMEGEKLLVSLRPEGKPDDMDYEGWPRHKFHVTEASKVVKVSP